MKALITTLLLAASIASAQEKNRDYRDYLSSIEGSELWFRIGSYSLDVEGAKTPVDLYYRDSDMRPDGKAPQWTVYPNNFGLFCVWRNKNGEWQHVDVAKSGRCTFHQIVSIKDEHIVLELRPKFVIEIKPDDEEEDVFARLKRGEEINAPFQRVLAFHEGVPILKPLEASEVGQPGEPKPKQAKVAEPDFLTGDQVKVLFSKRLTAGKTVVFYSRDGKFYGMDSDSLISFGKDGEAILGEYGYAYQGYRGSYFIEDDGVISVKLKGYRGKWPDMKVSIDGDSVRLFSSDGNGNFVFGGRAGGVLTPDMKPFWPFGLVETESTPRVTPIYTGGELKKFICPQIPDGFEWKGGLIRFRLDIDLSKEGVPVVQKYWSQDGEKIEGVVGQFPKGDWRLPVIESAKAALEQWEFYPEKADGNPISMGGGWRFEAHKIEDMVRWVVSDGYVTVFDSMPRLREE